MIVLDRKLQEGFWIDGRIFIKVLSIGKRRVKLGIEAPEELEILREELGGKKPVQLG
ncbi:MAG: carbon storage regulator [Candidatus Woykebacteria bacterium]